MSWEVAEQVCGGYRIIDSDTGLGVAIALQRDEHPALGLGITDERANTNAHLIAAAAELRENLSNLVGLARAGAAHLGKYHAALAAADAAIAKSYGQQQ